MTNKWNIDGALRDINNDLERGLDKALIHLEYEAVQRISGKREPEMQAVDTGTARAAINHERIGLDGYLIGAIEYFFFIEFGRKPGKNPPIQPIKDWLKRKGLDEGLAYPIAKKIGQQGIKPKPILRTTINKNLTEIKNIIQRELND